jgi:hypothetical protein
MEEQERKGKPTERERERESTGKVVWWILRD